MDQDRDLISPHSTCCTHALHCAWHQHGRQGTLLRIGSRCSNWFQNIMSGGGAYSYTRNVYRHEWSALSARGGALRQVYAQHRMTRWSTPFGVWLWCVARHLAWWNRFVTRASMSIILTCGDDDMPWPRGQLIDQYSNAIISWRGYDEPQGVCILKCLTLKCNHSSTLYGKIHQSSERLMISWSFTFLFTRGEFCLLQVFQNNCLHSILIACLNDSRFCTCGALL